VLAQAREEVEKRLPGTVKYALLIFLTHDPTGARVGVPPLEERHPLAVRSMAEARAEGAKAAPGANLFFFREDIAANDHHGHWHLVYRAQAAHAGDPEKDRQGELFVYMHQQMLARYDTERLALGMPLVEPLDMRVPIAEGYTTFAIEKGVFGSRPPNRRVGSQTAARYHQTADRYLAAARDRTFDHAVEGGGFPRSAAGPQPGLDLLGATIEAHAEKLPGFDTEPDGMHNDGHGVLASLSDAVPGVMNDTSVAIRDPVFWQWHRLIDDVGHAWQETQGPRDFSAASDAPPPVRLRKTLPGGQAGESPDVILCTRAKIGVADLDRDAAAAEAFGVQHFGGSNWDADFAAADPATSELGTVMKDRTVDLLDGTSVNIRALEPADDFAYFLRLENTSAEETEVTVRIFLVAEQAADNRRLWIEMDKFLHTLGPSERAVVYRPSTQSSVIRRPPRRSGVMPPPDEHSDPTAYCQCGWGYNMLLPRGTPEGMPFRLLVMLTDAARDRLEPPGTCGSMSFCGARDRYPDRRNMGYPFDRPLQPSVTAVLDGLANTARRSLTIRRVA
jgi:hypothetical protein